MPSIVVKFELLVLDKHYKLRTLQFVSSGNKRVYEIPFDNFVIGEIKSGALYGTVINYQTGLERFIRYSVLRHNILPSLEHFSKAGRIIEVS